MVALGIGHSWRRLFGLRLLRLVRYELAPFADARLASHLAAEVVQAALADVAVAQDVDLVDARRVDHERPLHTDPMGHAPDGEVLAQATAGNPDHRALEHLDSFARAFDDLRVDTHGVAGTQSRDLRFLLLLSD